MNLKKLIRSVAPALATALGGPLAGSAVREIAVKVLGQPDATEREVASALESATPEQMTKLRELDQQYALKMAELGIKLEELNTQDRGSARAREIAIRDWTPQVLAVAITTTFMILIFAMFRGEIPPNNGTAFNILLGLLGGAMTQILSYYFGSSRGSSSKDETISDALMRKP